MLPRKIFEQVLEQKALYGCDKGSCFGVFDSSRLRRPFSKNSISEVSQKEEFEEGKVRYKIAKTEGDLHPYKTIDRELAQGFRARVVLNSELFRVEEFVDEWFADKIPYTDLATKKLGYIIERF